MFDIHCGWQRKAAAESVATRVIFPDGALITQLAGAMVLEQNGGC